MKLPKSTLQQLKTAYDTALAVKNEMVNSPLNMPLSLRTPCKPFFDAWASIGATPVEQVVQTPPPSGLGKIFHEFWAQSCPTGGPPGCRSECSALPTHRAPSSAMHLVATGSMCRLYLLVSN